MNNQVDSETIEITNAEKVKAIDLPFDFSKTDKQWEKYGITSSPLLLRDNDGNLYDDRKLKGIFRDNKYHRIVGRNYVVFPNEEVQLVVDKALAEHNDLHLERVHNSHNGDAMYWEIRSDKLNQVIKGSWEKGDEVASGCIVRNSVGAGVALGIDMFTYRLSCKNGAIARGHDLASLAMKHYRTDAASMILTISRRIYDVIKETAMLFEEYKKAATLKFTRPMAAKMTDRVPNKYLPKYIQVEKGVTNLTDEKKTVWEAFNDITENLWHGEQSFISKADALQHAHTVMIAVNRGKLK